MSKLYIIGNGFDLKHELPTSYYDFALYCKGHENELFEDINRLFTQISKDSLWSNFEDGLGYPDEEIMYNEYYLPYSKDVRNDGFLDLKNQLSLAFKEWIILLRTYVPKLTKRFVFDEDSIFISFNYTDVLESLYKVHNILHIHGFAEDGEKEDNAGYIYGHSRVTPSPTEEFDSWDYQSKDFIESLKKDYQKDKLVEYIKSNPNITDIIVLGHSLNPIDDEYFLELAYLLPNVCWHVDYFDYKDYHRKIKNLCRIGIKDADFFKS